MIRWIHANCIKKRGEEKIQIRNTINQNLSSLDLKPNKNKLVDRSIGLGIGHWEKAGAGSTSRRRKP